MPIGHYATRRTRFGSGSIRVDFARAHGTWHCAVCAINLHHSCRFGAIDFGTIVSFLGLVSFLLRSVWVFRGPARPVSPYIHTFGSPAAAGPHFIVSPQQHTRLRARLRAGGWMAISARNKTQPENAGYKKLQQLRQQRCRSGVGRGQPTGEQRRGEGAVAPRRRLYRLTQCSLVEGTAL